MQTIHTQYYQSPVGEIIIGEHQGNICLCDWRYRQKRDAIDTRIKKYLQAEFVWQSTAVIDQTIEQLQQYFQQQRSDFTVPLYLAGSLFQKTVWQHLLQIPYGATLSYQQLAGKIGDSHAIRAVANANGANAISIIVPCHRIIGSKGELTGYAGGLPAKASLLQLEGSHQFTQ